MIQLGIYSLNRTSASSTYYICPIISSTNALQFTVKLPIEIQLQILEDNVDPYELDQAIRHNFPHLIDRYLKTHIAHFTKWFEALGSRDNLRYPCSPEGEP